MIKLYCYWCKFRDDIDVCFYVVIRNGVLEVSVVCYV